MNNVFFNQDFLFAEKEILNKYNLSSLNLMKSAGINSAAFIKDYFYQNSFRQVIIFCGKGNNAGDGLVIAGSLLSDNIPVKLILCYEIDLYKGDALYNLNLLLNSNSKYLEIISSINNLKFENSSNELVVDCLFGIGFKGEPDNKTNDVINLINSFKKQNVISIDIPSGLSTYNSNLTVNASHTLSMGAYKFETLFDKGKLCSGKVRLIDIGISQKIFSEFNTKNIYKIELSDYSSIKRKLTANKYSNGKVFILAGNINYPGAAILTAKASFRTGSGAVVSALPENIYSHISENIIESVKLPLAVNSNSGIKNNSENFEKIKDKILWSDCTVLGPGLGRDAETMSLIIKIIAEIPGKYIIDADALFAFNSNIKLLRNSNSELIITPHTGEFLNLTGYSKSDLDNNIYELTKSFAADNNINLLLKGSTSIFTNGKITLISNFGKENLASFGTGDILSGILASCFATLNSPEKSVINSLLIQGLSSEFLYNINQNSMIASDMLDVIPKIILELENNTFF
ncbi:MAG TPA: NAD(P)H-hydrate dehydratase [Ignavibacteria bacterium]|nr:NAD(P)H-hydrate dehydratase [Ignavibacteria bacterium]